MTTDDCSCRVCTGISAKIRAGFLPPGDYRTHATPTEVKFLKRALSRPWTSSDGTCPFCHEGPCSHWDGMGWVNPRGGPGPSLLRSSDVPA